MNEKPSILQRVSRFLAGKGFYMVLALCIITLTASGVYLYRAVNQSLADLPADAPAKVDVPVQKPVISEPEFPKPEPEPEPVPEQPPAPPQEEPAPQPETPPEEPAEPKEPESRPTMQWPLEGQVISAFNEEELTYSELLGDWRTHSAVEIAAPLGTEVAACANGAVFSIEEDPFTGTTLTLIHADGLKTVYGNLNADTLNVSQGDGVEQGDVLASLGSGAGSQPYLHFAVLLNDTPVDPAPYLS